MDIENYELGAPGDKDSIGIIYYVSRGIFILSYSVISGFMIWMAIKELKKQYIDLFRVIQYFNLILHFLFGIATLILVFSAPNTDLYSIKYLYMFDVNMYCFEMINQVSWLTLIVHLKYYKETRTTDYMEVRKKVIRFENYMISMIGVVHLFLFLVMIFIIVFHFVSGCVSVAEVKTKFSELLTVCQASYLFQLVIYHCKSVLNFTFIVTKLILFFVLSRSLKKNLNYYYQKKHRDLVILTVISIVYMMLSGILGVLDYKYDIDIRSINRFEHDKSLSNAVRIFYL
jgi:hypothetical protein